MKKLILFLIMISTLLLTSCSIKPYRYQWQCYYIYNSQERFEANISSDIKLTSVYIYFRPDGTYSFRDYYGNIYSGEYKIDEDNFIYCDINNQSIKVEAYDPILGNAKLQFTFESNEYMFKLYEDHYWEYDYQNN